jgi:tetratricopeptide (TPR) repeat protein
MQVDSPMIGCRQKDFIARLGYNYLKNNKFKEAIVVYQALYHLFPESEHFSFCLSYLYLKQKQYEKALYYIEIYLVDRKGTQKLAYLIKSQALFNLDRLNEAKKCAQTYLMS